MNYITLILFITSYTFSYGQNITGTIVDEQNRPISHVRIRYEDSDQFTYSDSLGHFEIAKDSVLHTIVLSKLGYESQEFCTHSTPVIYATMKGRQLHEVVINAAAMSKKRSSFEELIAKEELGKLACCNLAESFENSNTVDVNYSDGITGSREIQMLGLAGVYSQQLWEGTTYHRGLTQQVSLEFVPGPWLNSITVNKGIGSVANGYENISGQINLDFIKPRSTDKLMLNGYQSDALKTDVNMVTSWPLSKQWASNLFGHFSTSRMMIDNNGDVFMDMPIATNVNIMNKWQFFGKNGFVFNMGIQAASNDIKAGEITHDSHHNPYEIFRKTQELQWMAKTGWQLDEESEESIGFNYRWSYTTQNGSFGTRAINSHELFANINGAYQKNWTHEHKIKVGLNALMDLLDEQLSPYQFQKKEWVQGLFAEHTYRTEMIHMTSGLRVDWHNVLGLFVTPRLHIKWTPSPSHHMTLSMGSGFRTPSMLTEASGYLISNRIAQFPSDLKAEKAWNFGLGYFFNWELASGIMSSVDANYFLTLFQNQWLMNIENPGELKAFYLDGNSRSQSIQIDNNWDFYDRLSIRLSYKNDQVTALYDGIKKDIPLIKQHKLLANVAVKSKNKHWSISTTFLVNGPARIPTSVENQETYSPWYTQLHAQINYMPNKHWDLYLGSENILSYTQYHRIIQYQNTQSNGFDAAMIWGPMDIRRMYIGLKWKW